MFSVCPQSNTIINTAILNNQPVSLPVIVLAVSHDGKVSDVTSAVTCHSTNENTIKVQQIQILYICPLATGHHCWSLFSTSCDCLHPVHRCPVTAPPSSWTAANQGWAAPAQWWRFCWVRSVALCVCRCGRRQCPCRCPWQTPFSTPSVAGTTSLRMGTRQHQCVFTLCVHVCLCVFLYMMRATGD